MADNEKYACGYKNSQTGEIVYYKDKDARSQLKDIANYSLTKGTDGKVYIKKQDGTLLGDGIEVGSDVDLSKISMSMSGQTLKLLNDGKQVATVEIPTATVTDEKLTSIIQAKIDDGTLSSATITDKSVTNEKLADDISNNLVQVTKTEIDNLIGIEDFIKNNIGLYPTNGNEFSSTGLMVTDFISIKSNKTYAFVGFSKVGVYNSSKKFIKYVSSPLITDDSMTYIKCEASMSSTNFYFGENIKACNLYLSYGNELPGKLNTTTVLNPNIPILKSKFDKLFNIEEKYINLIDSSKIKNNTRLNTTNGYANSTRSGSCLIYFTEIEYGETYTLCTSQKSEPFCFYDENYTFIKKVDVVTEQDIPFTFTLDVSFLGEELTNIKYIRFSTDGSYGGKFEGIMLVKGNEITEYVPFNDFSKTKMNNVNTILNQILELKDFFKLKDKKWIAHGDSITYYSSNYEQYVKYANNYLYCELTNLGNPGTTMALRNSETVDSATDADDKLSMAYLSSVTDYSKYDVCTIFFGTNDMSSNVPIGTVDSTDEKTYLGALNKSIQRMYASNYKLKILLITPIYRIEETNLGLDAYRTALNDFGKKHGIPVVNMHELCNINAFNKSDTLKDGLHPTGTGAEHIGAVLAGEMLRYF
jgi:lysophospholipase L1-like esterase